LRNEITIHRELDHPNIARMHEVYENETQIIIVMDYARGKRLIDYVIRNGPVPEADAILIMKSLFSAVGYLHDNNYIHRDIKLENIMIDANDDASEKFTVKLIDFGLSVTADNTKLFERSGTPGYVAPEILCSRPYGSKVDIFSLGVVLFTM